MAKFICLRDDDTCFVTQPEDLSLGYGEFWGIIPITLATIPFVHPASLSLSDLYKPGEDKYKALREFEKNASASFLTEYYRFLPVGGNEVLIDFLSPLVNNNLVEIAQHGVFHRYSESGPEMLSSKISYEAIRDGKEYLEKVFGIKINTFVPPSNTIDVRCLSWIRQLGLHAMTSGSIHRNGDYKKVAYDVATLPQRVYNKYLGTPWSKRPMTRQFGVFLMHSMTFGVSTEFEPFLEELRKRLEKFGFASIATHYTCFSSQKCKEDFWRLLATLKEKDRVEFVTATEYYKMVKEHLF